MWYFLAGIAVLVVALTAIRGFTSANPHTMARQLKTLAGVASLGVAALFLFRGMVAQALMLGFVGWWLLGWLGAGQIPGWPSPGTRTPGNTSRVTTDHLDVELDLDTGDLQGRVLKGMFQGRALESLKPVEMALLWQDCQFTDPQSARIIEAHLDRVHPTWREDMARGEKEMASGPDGRMSPDEALEILGLEPGAGEEAIRKAHRELMLKLHPDRGGSTYLASKINEAKDVLLREG